MFLGVPGLVVVAIGLRHEPGVLLRRAVLEDPRPVGLRCRGRGTRE
jgi:hypothetical protein